MSLKHRLRSIFGWERSAPTIRKFTRDDATPLVAQFSMSDRYHDELGLDRQKRQDRYDVYDAMDQMSDVSTVLDAYAEDATQLDHENEKTVWIESENKKLKDEGEFFLHNVLRIEDWIEGNARDLGKYGDDFAKVIANPKDGVTGIFWRDPRDIERVENREGTLVGFEEVTKFPQYKQKIEVELAKGKNEKQVEKEVLPTYKPWDMIHFRIYRRKRLSHEKWPNIYGTSLLAGSERIAKQVKILDDLLMIMRLTRSLDRHAYFVDTGKSPVEEEVRILKRWKRALKRKTYIDPSTGRYDSRFDPFAFTEDIFWPVNQESNSRIERHEGITDVKEITDIDHFRDKFYGSLRAPKAYFGFEGDINSKATLSNQSLKWARAAASLQRGIRQGLKRLCQIHFAYKGLSTDSEDFEVMMQFPSLLELLDKLEAWQSTIDVAERMAGLGESLQLDRYDWTVYILQNVLWLTKQDVEKFAKGIPKTEEEPTQDTSQQQKKPQQDDPESPETPDSEPEEESHKNRKKKGLTEIDAAIKQVIKRGNGHNRRLMGALPHELPPVIKEDKEDVEDGLSKEEI